jgi:aspartyl-tRNA synthetase
MISPVGMRTHRAGELTPDHIGAEVTLCGWVATRRDHGGVAFVDLRDASGVVQVVIHDEAVAHPLRSEFCLRVVGTVTRRPEGNDNPNLSTGTIEVEASSVEVLSEAAPLPFQIEEHEVTPISDEVRYKYRYLDLRRASSAAAIRLRSSVNQAARSVLLAEGFVEVETPTLTRSTPEGARDFVVPARLQPGSWYALPQSPQLFKQLLMVSGLERYFQIARCYRDEDFRADRQPEFTQLDLEMSFVVEDDVIALGERIIAALWALIGVDVPLPIPRVTYAEAMRRFGTDKPDLRFGQELVDCTGYFAGTDFGVFQAEHVGAVVMPGGAAQTRKVLDGWQDWAKARGARGLAYVLVGDDGELKGPVAKNLSEEERAGLAAHCGAQPGDCIFFGAGSTRAARALLGAARLEIGHRCDLIDQDAWAFTWVVDAPLFEPQARATMLPSVRGLGRRCTTRSPPPSPRASTRSTPTRVPRSPTPTTSCATATRSGVARSASIATTCNSGCSRSWASVPRRPRRSSASSSKPSATAHRPMAASPSAGIASVPC